MMKTEARLLRPEEVPYIQTMFRGGENGEEGYLSTMSAKIEFSIKDMDQ
jgi:hypothetical protein